jgi:hypothetical protein
MPRKTKTTKEGIHAKVSTGDLKLTPVMVSEQALKDARRELEDYPAWYDAHKDGLAEKWDHEQRVNNLLRCLRKLLAEVR